MERNEIKLSFKVAIILIVLFFVGIFVVGIFAMIHDSKSRQGQEVSTNKEDYVTINGEKVLFSNLAEDPDSWDRVCEKLNNKEYEEKYNSEVYNKVNQTGGTLSLDKEKIRKLNEEIYKVEIDLNENKAIINEEEEVNAKEYFNLPENVTAEELSNSLGNLMTGDIDIKDGKIEVDNTYKTNALLIGTKNLEQIESLGNVKYITKLAADVYSVDYYNAIDTKEAYKNLSENQLVNVSKDEIGKVLSDSDSENGQNVQSNLNLKQKEMMGIDKYLDKLSTTNNKEVRVAVLDTGANINHPILKDRIDEKRMYNCIENTKDVTDNKSHGTNVSSIIAQFTPSSVKIVPIKISNDGAVDRIDTLKAVVKASGECDVINCSFGFGSVDQYLDMDFKTRSDEEKRKEAWEEAHNKMDDEAKIYKEVADKGVLVVCAAGNDAKETSDINFYNDERDLYDFGDFPADWPENISVSGVDLFYEKDQNSNFGKNVSFCAPYYMDFIKEDNGESTIETEMGTSFSAPCIVAACALVKTEHPEYSKNQIINVLKENCIDLGDKGKDKYYGYGFVDFRKKMFAKDRKNSDDSVGISNFEVIKQPNRSWILRYEFIFR